jgi:hypothetical protein
VKYATKFCAVTLVIAIAFESSAFAQQPIEADETSQMQTLDEKALKAKAERLGGVSVRSRKSG